MQVMLFSWHRTGSATVRKHSVCSHGTGPGPQLYTNIVCSLVQYRQRYVNNIRRRLRCKHVEYSYQLSLATLKYPKYKLHYYCMSLLTISVNNLLECSTFLFITFIYYKRYSSDGVLWVLKAHLIPEHTGV